MTNFLKHNSLITFLKRLVMLLIMVPSIGVSSTLNYAGALVQDANLKDAKDIAVSLDNKHAYITSEGSQTISIYSINQATGALSLQDKFKNGDQDNVGTTISGISNPLEIAFSSTSNYVLIASNQISEGIAVFLRDPITGLLTFINSFNDISNGVRNITTLNIVNDYVYATSSNFSSIYVLSLNTSNGVLTFLERLQSDGTDSAGTDLTGKLVSIQASTFSPGPDYKHFYVVDVFTQSVDVFNRDNATGKLTFIESLVSGGFDGGGINTIDDINNPSDIVIPPDGKHVYVGNVSISRIAIFNRDDITGQLSVLPPSTGGVASLSVKLTASPDNNHIVVSRFNSTLQIFDRDSTSGALTFSSSPSLLTGSEGSAFANSGNTFLVASSDEATVTVFDRNPADGVLTFTESNGNFALITGLEEVFDFSISNDGLFAYSVAVVGSAINTYNRNTNSGELTIIDSFKTGDTDASAGTIPAINKPNVIKLSPDANNSHVYIADFISNAIQVFSRDITTGRLSFVETLKHGSIDNMGTTITGLNRVFDIVISPDGNQVYSVASSSDSLAVFDRDPVTGILTFITSIAGSVDPNDPLYGLDGVEKMNISPDGTSIYALSKIRKSINVFSRNVNTGVITFIESLFDEGVDSAANALPNLNNPTSIIISADNKFAYVTADGSQAINIFNRNMTDGSLTISESVINSGTDSIGQNMSQTWQYPWDMTFNSDQSRIYAVSQFRDAAITFDRNSITGSLIYRGIIKNGNTDGTGSVVENMDAPNVIVISPDDNFLYFPSVLSDSIAYLSLGESDISMTSTTDTYTQGDEITLSTIISNIGAQTISNPIVEFALSNVLTFVSGSNCNLVAANNNLTCTLPPLTSGTNTVKSIIVTATHIGDGTISATASMGEKDTNNVNNDVTFDIFINTPPIITASQTFSINENSSANTAVGTIVVVDANSSSSTSAFTIISGDPNSAFSIDNNGNITVNGSIDFESTPSYTLIITATDSLAGLVSAQETITITVIDIPDTPPTIDTPSGHTYTIDENTTNVGTVLASDTDGSVVSFTISGNDPNNVFAINNNGLITANGILDFETKNVFQIFIRVTDNDGLSSTDVPVLINLNNLNDNTPVVTPSQLFSIDENVAPSSAVGTVMATDGDTNGVITNYSVVGGNTGNAFTINATGIITVTGTLDFETLPNYTLMIKAFDGANTSSAQAVTININNLPDVTPLIDASPSLFVTEDVAIGATVGTITATDVDGSIAGFRIESGNTNNDLSISSSGQITTSNTLDFETTTNYQLSVIATDNDGLDSAPLTVLIVVTNIDEDTDGDGVLDSEDNNPNDATTASVVTTTGTGTVTIVTSAGTLSVVETLATNDATLSQTNMPTDVTFDHAVISYNVTGLGNGDFSTITITLPSAIGTNSKIYKVSTTATGTGYTLVDANNYTINGTQLTITLQDGGFGDEDGVANGVIVDPIAIGTPKASGGGGGAFNLFAMLMLFVFVTALRRQQR